MDVIQEVVAADDETGKVTLYIQPDPRRYEWRTGQDGERVLYDRFDHLIMGHDLVMQMLREALQMKPLPQPQTLGNTNEYVALRADIIRNRLSGEATGAPIADPAAAALNQHVGKRHLYVALVMDITNSTTLAHSVDTEVWARVISTMTDEASAVLPSFYGHTLKYTGDGLIAVFAAPNFIRMNDHALDCALSIRRLIYEGLNPALTEWGYPTIDVRIGIEAGEGVATLMGDTSTKRSIDLIGDFINMAAKLQSMAPPGGIYVGYVCERNLHIAWREQLVRVDMTSVNWPYQDDQGSSYPVYSAPDLQA